MYSGLDSKMDVYQIFLLVFMGFMSNEIGLSNAVAVNVALNKPITATGTCGSFGSEVYYSTSQIFMETASRIEHQCVDATVHPPQAMVDGNTSTWWQSASRSNIYDNGVGDPNTYRETTIDVDLEQVFQLESVQFKLGESRRPGRIEILKSLDGQTYTRWLYQVNVDVACANDFGLDILDKPTSANSILCTLFSAPVAANLDEIITFDVAPFNAEFYEFSQARYLRINFYEMELVHGFQGDSFQHFTVRELVVLAECSCFGHHTDCQQDSITGQYECVCGHNTQGRYCEQCLPFYNQQPHSNSKPCEACFCYGHAEQCYYNATIAQFNMSLNTNRVKEGGGVCINCLNHTAGLNCEKCEDYYFRPVGRAQAEKNGCVSCDCDRAGVTVHRETGLLGDCLMNEDAIADLGMIPGDCFCKVNVAGSKCDQCKPGYYNLRGDNSQGCQDCLCDVAGTTNGSPICLTDAGGECPCKRNVIGRQCNVCQVGYFGLDTNNTNGCDPCNCDVGGTSTMGCDKVLGVCTCQLYVTGRQCDRPREGYYYPDLHFINSEMEDRLGNFGQSEQYAGFLGFGYAVVQENETVSTTLTIPSNLRNGGQFYILIRYWAEQEVTGEVTVTGEVSSTSVTFSVCARWCVSVIGASKLYNLMSTQHKVSLTVSGQVLVDRVVVLPEEFFNPIILAEETDTFKVQCNIVGNFMQLGTSQEVYCLSKVFTVTTNYLKGALPCNCDLVGSNSTVCAPYAGQCSCRPGFGGRKCDQCLAGFYLPTLQGCLPCDCAGIHKICSPRAGQCVCPYNTIGRQCDLCAPNTFQWTETDGCTACNCHSIGSNSQQCNLTTGVCHCKLGVTGDKCNQCEDEFMGLSTVGCYACNCDAAGSISPVCNKTTGQCPCKDNTAGLLCNQCKAGAYDLDVSHPQGCLDCICMGVTSHCDSSDLTLSQQVYPLVNLEAGSGALVSKMDLVTALDIAAGVNVSAVQDDVIGDYIEASVDGSQSLYWKYTEESQSSSLGLYGSSVDFDVFIGPTSGAFVSPTAYMVLGTGPKLSYSSFTAVPQNASTRLHLPVVEYDWKKESGDPISRGEFLLALTNIRSWLFPATFYSSPHITRLSNVSYTVGVSGNIGGDLAVRLEHCQCGAAYEGLSCERCAPGYKRANVTEQGYLGVCVPCECNGHSDQCLPDTGECTDCQHNTQGFSCERCQIGFFGEGCSQCPCFEPRVTDKSCAVDVNGTVECLHCNDGYVGAKCDRCKPFHYGQPELLNTGTCTPCDCNGNSQSCDPISGVCVSCGSNTVGDNCERCADEFFGNASLQNCQLCACDMAGSNNTICEHLTGQCPCHPGVGKRICDQCQVGYWGYTNQSVLGCMSCDCNVQGSSNEQCDDQTGICSCKPDASGDKCDRCAVGSWGLPHKACSVCACDATGSVNSSQPCELVLGQCACKPGVAGRQCDTCQRLYNGFGPEGCTACGDCQFSLGNDTARLQEQWQQEYWTNAVAVGAIQEQDQVLQGIDTDLTNLGLSELTLADLTGLVDNLTNEAPAHIQSVSGLQTTLDSQLSASVILHNNTGDELTRLTGLQIQSETSAMGVNNGHAQGRDYIDTLTTFNNSASNLLNDGVVVSGSIDVSFSDDLQLARQEQEAVQNSSDKADVMKGQVMAQEAETTALEGRAQNVQSEAATIQERTAIVQLALGEVRVVGQATQQAINDTLHHLAQISSLDTETEGILALAQALWTESRDSYQAARQMDQDCLHILDNPNNTPLPINTTADISGVVSWTLAAANLEQGLGNTFQNIQNIAASVSTATGQAAQLRVDSQQLSGEFKTVQHLGQAAVAAVQNYEQVMASLNTSLGQADEADKTLQSAQQTLASVTLLTLQVEANASKVLSTRLLAEVNNNNYQADVLESRLQSANASLQNVVQEWEDIDTLLGQVEGEASTIQPIAKGTGINILVNEANSLSDSAKTTADQTVNNNNALLTTLNALSGESVVVQSQSENASNIVATLDNSIQSYENLLTGVTERVDYINTFYSETNRTRSALDDKLTALEAKVQQARELAKRLRQPVKFNRNSVTTISNPDVLMEKACNKVTLEYKAPAKSNALLFFSENNGTGAMLALELDKGFVVFQFTINLERVGMTNPAEVGENQWARVEASRCGNTGQMSVTLLTTGATAMVYKAGVASNARTMMLTSPFYIGGLPDGYVTTKVASSNFEGCLYNVKYGDQDMDLWAKRVSSGEAQCCRKPLYFTDVRLNPGTTFTGFGYLQLAAQTLNVTTNSLLTFKFRTFQSEGSVVFLIDSPAADVYYGLFMDDNGKIIFDYGSTGNINQLQTTRTYFDGEWYMVTTFHNSTHQELILHYNVNGTFFEQDRLSQPRQSVDLSSLAGAPITFGGQNPNTGQSRGPVSHKFAASMLDFRHGTPTDLTSLIKRSFDSGVLYEKEIKYDQVIPEIIPGITLSSDNSYAQLNVVQLASTKSLSIYFATNDANGIVAYTVDEVNPTVQIYVALSHGNVELYYNEMAGAGLKGPVNTRGLYLSDGALHHIQVNFKTSLRVDLTVDDLVIEDTKNSLVFSTVAIRGYLYLGGVPDTVPLNQALPVKNALVCGVKLAQINGVNINFFDPELFVAHKDVSIEGMAKPRSFPLPPPYTIPDNLPPVPTSCKAPSTAQHSSEGVRFGTGSVSFQKFQLLPEQINALTRKFVLTMEFRALASNGILFYVADRLIDPVNWFCLFLEDGAVVLSMRTSTHNEKTLRLSSSEFYNTGTWWEVNTLRINDFLALVLKDEKDYQNTDMDPAFESYLTLATPVYIGGVDMHVTGNLTLPLPIGKMPFIGCIRKVEITTAQDDIPPFFLNLQDPLDAAETASCYSNIKPGVRLSGESAHITAATSFSYSFPFEFSVNITTTSRSANILTIRESVRNFIVLDIYQGQIRCMLGNPVDSDFPFIAVSMYPVDEYTICNNMPHRVYLLVKQDQLTLQIGTSEVQTFPFPVGFSPTNIANVPIYVGGLPSNVKNTLVFPESVSLFSFTGCLAGININGNFYDPQTVPAKDGVHFGCFE